MFEGELEDELAHEGVNVILTPDAFVPDIRGGFNRIIRLAKPLRDYGVTLCAFTVRRPHHESERDSVEGIPIFRFELQSGLNPYQIRSKLYNQAVATAFRFPDLRFIVEPPAPFWTTAEAITMMRNARRIPILLDCGNTPEMVGGKLKRILSRAKTSLAARPIQAISVLSSEMKRALTRAGYPARKICVIPNGIDHSEFRPATDKFERAVLRKRFGLSERAKVVIFVGSVIPRKRLEMVLDGWNTVTDAVPVARLLVAGSVGARASHDSGTALGEYADRIRATISRLRVPDSVSLLGEIENVSELYRCADLFVMTSREEGVPNALLEAMASGVCSVITPFHGVPKDGEELGISGVHHIKVRPESSAVGHTVAEWLGEPRTTERAEIGNQSRNWIIETQSLEETARNWAKLYHAVSSIGKPT